MDFRFTNWPHSFLNPREHFSSTQTPDSAPLAVPFPISIPPQGSFLSQTPLRGSFRDKSALQSIPLVRGKIFRRLFFPHFKKKKKKRKGLNLVAAFGISLYLTCPLLWKKSNHRSRRTLFCNMPGGLEKLVLKTGLCNSVACQRQAWGLVFPLILPRPLVP